MSILAAQQSVERRFKRDNLVPPATVADCRADQRNRGSCLGGIVGADLAHQHGNVRPSIAFCKVIRNGSERRDRCKPGCV